MPGNDQSLGRFLQMSAYVVILAWGIRAASHILSVVLIALLLSYAILPFPKWLMHRFQLRKGLAILLTVILVMLVYSVISVALIETIFRMHEKLPIYEEHIRSLYERIAVFLSSHGVQSASISLRSFYSSERMIEFMRIIIPEAAGFISDRVLVWMLSLIFLIEMADADGAETGRLARNLVHYGKDVQRFISITAQTGAITAVANLVVLVALGVDFPVLWCFLFFFLHFIPNVGFIISLVPPALVALLTFGWKRALLVVLGFILTEMIADYLIQPMLMKKGLHISFLEIVLSLMVWGFLLGPAGAILAIPLTMALKKFIDEPLTHGKPVPEPASR